MYKIRQLKKSDQTRISNMFLSLVDKIDDNSIREIISPSSDGASGAQLTEEQRRAAVIRAFMSVFTKCIRHLGADVKAFFADLLGVTVEEYDDLPFDIDIQVIEQLKEAKEVENFFTGALQLFSANNWLREASSKLRNKFDSATVSGKKN